MRMVENAYPPPLSAKNNTNMVYAQAIPPVRPQAQPSTVHRTNTTMSVNENKSAKSNITIEMDERLINNERAISPKSRERNLNKVVKNVGHIVEDAKKRYHGDVPSKVIVRVDENAA